MDDDYYLQPNFDSSTLRVADLRGILLKHDVPYSSSAKKADLLALFNQHIAPRAAELRAASAVVLPSTTGMINAGETPPVRRTGRRSTRGATEDDETPAKTPARTPARSTRRSSAKPVVYETPAREPTEEPALRQDENDTPFSNKNPFQSGSPANVKSPLGASARKVRLSAVGAEPERERSPEKREVARRRTEVGGAFVPRASERRRTDVPRTVEREVVYAPEKEREERMPVYRKVEDRAEEKPRNSERRRSSRREPVVKEESEYGSEAGDMSQLIEPGEEFVPEEAAELAAAPRMEVAETVQGFDGVAFLLHILSFVKILIVPMVIGYGLWYRSQKIQIGYCGVGGLGAVQHHQNHILDWVSPECEPCPPHARCFPNFHLECEDNYIKSEKWMSLNGLLPVAPDCLPDTARERRISIMSDAALQILRESGAHQRCKERFLSSDMPIEGVSEEDIRQVLYNRKSAALSDREFAELWRAAIGDVAKHDEISVREDENGTVHYASSSLAALPLGCYARFWLQESVARHKGVIAGIITLLFTIFQAHSKLSARREYNEKVTRLVHICLRRLSQHAARNPANPYVAIVHLRDQVLEREFSIKKRQELWNGVEKIVEMNSNVRVAEREIEGEPLRVWSWIGGKFIDDGRDEEMVPARGIKQEPVEEEKLALPEGREEKVHWNARRRNIL